ncbi:MAG: MFS transporter [Geminicoccaceae bacterium]|nr:MAG: MFS transporter [Geminicoccaceae bacterium]
MARATLSLAPPVGDGAVIGLVSLAHFFSHLYILALPPIFPVLSDELGVGVAALGLALAALNLTTILCQPPLGFLVDRVGAAPVLVAGHFLMAGAIAAIGLAPGLPALLACAVAAGLGNAVYHPADYAILGARVRPDRVGRAFAVHTFGGYLGFAAAPIVMVGLTALFGWRAALLLVGGAGLLVGLALLLFRGALATPPGAKRAKGEAGPADRRLLTSGPVLLALLFFVLLALGHGGITGFTPVVLERSRGLELAAANLPLAAFLVASTPGVLLGGWLADRFGRHGFVVATCSLVIAGVAAIAALASPPLSLLVLLFALGGLAAGIVAPSRDMLVKAVTPPGASGRVFGFVMVGFNLGGLVAPPAYGFLVDAGRPELVFLAVAVVSIVTVATVAGTAGRSPTPAG